QTVKCVVLAVDQERKRVALGMKQLSSDPWETDIPERYKPRQTVQGKVTKITNFGVFVELEPGLEGLLHVSELAEDKVDSPEAVVKVGDTIDVKVLKIDREERKIGLSRKSGGAEDEEIIDETPSEPKAPKEAPLKGGMGSGGGNLFTLPTKEEGE